MAEGNCLYERLKQQISFDGGQTWQDTGVYSTGNLIERDSPSCGYITEYVFVIPGVGREASTSVTSGASTVTYQITSTKNDSPIGYGIVAPEWCTVTSSSTGISISVDVNDTGTDRFGTVYLVQDESGIMIMIDIDQDSEENPPYVFTFDDGYTSKTASISEQGGGMMYQVISTYNGQTQSYSLSSAPAWATVDVSGNNVRVVVGENTGVTRSGVVTLVQSGSNKTITISLSQASSVPYVFTLDGGAGSLVINHVAYSGEYSTDIISTQGGEFVPFHATETPSWFHVTISGSGVTITIDNNPGHDRTYSFELVQSGSGDIIPIEVNQTGIGDYTFTFSGGSTYVTANASASGGSFCYNIVSTHGGDFAYYGLRHTPGDWVDIDIDGSITCLTISANTSSARTGIVTLEQSDSSKTIQINIAQQSGTTPVITGDYLTAIFLEDGEFFTDRDDVSYSVNGAPWSSIESYSLSQTFPAGTIVKYKCTESFGSLTPRLIFSKKVNVSGYPASMLYGDDFMEHLDSVPDKGFYRMFSPCHQTYNNQTGDYCRYCSFSIRSNNIVDASGIRLPATTVGEYAYYQMFEGNPYLTAAPAISATTLDKYCFQEMFKGCTSLATAPALPATTLAYRCYESMFSGCTSLTTVPTLPATTLAYRCYYQMFKGCTSLTTAPALSATTLSTGCYTSMFQGCTSLTTAPVLSASTLVGGCYERMFYGCSSLTGITCMATGDTDGNIYFRHCWSTGYMALTCRWEGHAYNWVAGVSPSGIFTKNAGTPIVEPTNREGWWKDDASGIPPGWIVADNGEYLFTLSNGEESAFGTSLYSGGSLTYGIVSEYLGSGVQYTASSSTSWLTTDVVGSSLTITIASNTNYQVRSGVITLTQTVSNKTITINVEQMQNFPPTPPEYDYLTFIALEDGFTISCNKDCYYKINEGGWSGTSYAVNAGDIIRVKGHADLRGQWRESIFNINGKRFNIRGCPASMTHGDDYASYMTVVAQKEFQYMFYGLPVVDASGVKLPATTLANACYQGMFYGCSSLTTAPELPATTLANFCYCEMFYGCTSLTTAPVLSATTLADYCYLYMFASSGLETAPTLPATTLATSCYAGMFQDCTSLTTAPSLPATTLANACYQGMFNNCTSLTTAPALSATTLATSCYAGMFQDCTSLTTAPSLPATTLATNCYSLMFANCTSLTTAPELPATTLTDGCYSWMFNSCTSLNYIKCLATDISANNCTNSWVWGVAYLGTFVKAAGMNDWTGEDIPQGWTVVDNV